MAHQPYIPTRSQLNVGKGSSNIASEEPHVLTSWKEVAAYLGKGVRTVQRWERELSLPVRRPYGSEKHVIVALPGELDEWMRTKMQTRAEGGGALALRAPSSAQARDRQARQVEDARHAEQLERLHRVMRVIVERTAELHRTSAVLVARAAELTRESKQRDAARKREDAKVEEENGRD